MLLPTLKPLTQQRPRSSPFGTPADDDREQDRPTTGLAQPLPGKPASPSQPTTFAQMQAQGIARPAPPSATPSPMAGPVAGPPGLNLAALGQAVAGPQRTPADSPPITPPVVGGPPVAPQTPFIPPQGLPGMGGGQPYQPKAGEIRTFAPARYNEDGTPDWNAGRVEYFQTADGREIAGSRRRVGDDELPWAPGSDFRTPEQKEADAKRGNAPRFQLPQPLMGTNGQPLAQHLQPPGVNLGSAFGGTGTASPTTGSTPFSGTGLNPQIEAALAQLLGRPSAYDDPAMQAEFARLAQGIDDEFSLDRQRLDEEMARRGLSDSTIFGGRLSDLNIGKRTAKTELADRLTTKRAELQQQALLNALMAAMGWSNSQTGWQFQLANHLAQNPIGMGGGSTAPDLSQAERVASAESVPKPARSAGQAPDGSVILIGADGQTYLVASDPRAGRHPGLR